jgi:hypothetical protein
MHIDEFHFGACEIQFAHINLPQVQIFISLEIKDPVREIPERSKLRGPRGQDFFVPSGDLSTTMPFTM